VIAHKMDPRVYVAADVEQLVGYAPMAQLPDFDEVSDEVAEEPLLRLATSIEFAANDSHPTSCVFTGTGPGVGVTTIVTRVTQMLGLLGKEAVLLDAAGAMPAERRPEPSDEPATAVAEFERSTRGSALIAHTGEGTASNRQGLMLTDTAPLTVSAEAEYMARRADCTILVIESGVTTRAQLRSAASSLQRLDPAAVGFVLNRVSLKNADESFRNSVSEVERHLRVQGRTAARTAAQSPRIVPKIAHVSLGREISAPAETAGRTAPQWAEPERAAVAPQPLPQPTPAVAENREPQSLPQPAPVAPASLREPAAPAAPRRPTALAALRNIAPPSLWLAGGASRPAQEPAVKPVRTYMSQPVLKPMPALDPIREPKPQPASWKETPPVQRPQDETPHWLTEEPPWWLAKAPTYAESAMEQPPTPRAGAWHSVAAHDRQKPAVAEVREEEKAADEMPTRLSGLRGILFSLGVKDLSPNKHAEPDGNGASADATPSHHEQTMESEASVPQPEPESVENKAEKTASRSAASRWVTAEPEFLPPPAEESNRGKESRWNLGKYDTGARDDIQILPSRRGQYKR